MATRTAEPNSGLSARPGYIPHRAFRPDVDSWETILAEKQKLEDKFLPRISPTAGPAARELAYKNYRESLLPAAACAEENRRPAEAIVALQLAAQFPGNASLVQRKIGALLADRPVERGFLALRPRDQFAQSQRQLEEANRQGIDAQIALLLSVHGKLDVLDESNKAPVHRAIDEKDLPMVEALLKAGADPQVPDGTGRPPLLIATERCYWNYVQTPRYVMVTDLSPRRDEHRKIILLLAAAIKAKRVSAQSRSTSTAVVAAHAAATAEFISRGAEMVRQTLAGSMPGRAVLAASQHALSQLAQSFPARPALRSGEQVAQRPESIDRWTNVEETILHAWSRLGDAEVTQALIDAGAAIDSLNASQQTPLHTAGSASAARALIQAGADLHRRDKNGRTPLHTQAIQPAASERIKVLLQAQADPSARDLQSLTPLELMLKHFDIWSPLPAEFFETAGLLVDGGADVAGALAYLDRCVWLKPDLMELQRKLRTCQTVCNAQSVPLERFPDCLAALQEGLSEEHSQLLGRLRAPSSAFEEDVSAFLKPGSFAALLESNPVRAQMAASLIRTIIGEAPLEPSSKELRRRLQMLHPDKLTPGLPPGSETAETERLKSRATDLFRLANEGFSKWLGEAAFATAIGQATPLSAG